MGYQHNRILCKRVRKNALKNFCITVKHLNTELCYPRPTLFFLQVQMAIVLIPTDFQACLIEKNSRELETQTVCLGALTSLDMSVSSVKLELGGNDHTFL